MPPAAPELVAEILDRGALQGFQRHDHELRGGPAFQVRELARELAARRPIEDARPVDDFSGELREIERRGGADPDDDEKERQEQPVRHRAPRRTQHGRESASPHVAHQSPEDPPPPNDPPPAENPLSEELPDPDDDHEDVPEDGCDTHGPAT